MTEVARSGFNWHELMTTDLEAARRFYREVSGLAVVDGPASPAGPYLLLMAGDRPVAGITGPTAEGPIWPSGGPQPHWLPYIAVEDVDRAAERTRALGGRVLVEPVDIPGFGRAAVLRDPQGAAFGVFHAANGPPD
jgi:predicted enzyme related to lactoylglutathione lyase